MSSEILLKEKLDSIRSLFKIVILDSVNELNEEELETFINNPEQSYSVNEEVFNAIVSSVACDELSEIIDYFTTSIDGLTKKQNFLVSFLMFEIFYLGRLSGLAKGLTREHGTLIEYTKFVKKRIQPENIAKEYFAKSGAMKFQSSRKAAFEWMQIALEESPHLSKNRLAAMLEAKSKEEGLPFGRIIPEGTAKDYARKFINDIKQGVE